MLFLFLLVAFLASCRGHSIKPIAGFGNDEVDAHITTAGEVKDTFQPILEAHMRMDETDNKIPAQVDKKKLKHTGTNAETTNFDAAAGCKIRMEHAFARSTYIKNLGSAEHAKRSGEPLTAHVDACTTVLGELGTKRKTADVAAVRVCDLARVAKAKMISRLQMRENFYESGEVTGADGFKFVPKETFTKGGTVPDALRTNDAGQEDFRALLKWGGDKAIDTVVKNNLKAALIEARPPAGDREATAQTDANKAVADELEAAITYCRTATDARRRRRRRRR